MKTWLGTFRNETRVSAVVMLLLLLPAMLQAAVDGRVRMYANDSNGNLFIIDFQTLQAEWVGRTAVAFTDIAFNAEGELYGITFAGLYKVDPQTAATSLIGAINAPIGGWNSLVFDREGTLWAAGPGSVITIDTSTGRGTPFATLDYAPAGDLAFDEGGNMYLTTSDGLLVRIDTQDGTVVEIGELPYTDVYGFGRGPDGQMYGVRQGHQLLSINLETGAAEHLGDVTADFALRAINGGSFPTEAVRYIIYVDDDAPGDPGPGDLSVSDPEEEGTREHPYDSIQEGIEAAAEGATVFVREGIYYETIDFMGKNINVTSFDPDADGTCAYPVIDGGHAGTVVTFDQGEDPSCQLSGFILTRGFGRPVPGLATDPVSGAAGAIACLGASPSISNCVIVGNRCVDPATHDYPGGTIYCVNSESTFRNCTVADNYAGTGGAGVYLINSNVVIENCIVRANLPEEIVTETGDSPIVSHSDVRGAWPGWDNVDVDPAFAFPGYWADLNDPDTPVAPDHASAMWLDGDYHLMSAGGRWDPIAGIWTKDEFTSPCVDAGDPVSPWQQEPNPNGERINLGAYGGTLQASMSDSRHRLVVSSEDGGAVSMPGQGTFLYEDGTLATVEATPEPYYRFVGWTGTAAEVGKVADLDAAHTTVIVDGDYTLHANFALEQHVLVVNSNEGGWIYVVATGVGFVEQGFSDRTFNLEHRTRILLMAIPQPGYEFESLATWSGSFYSTTPCWEFSLEEDWYLAATFVQEQCQ